MGPLLLTDDFVKGEMKCGLSGYLYVQCSSCMELNRVLFGSEHGDPSKPKAKGMPTFSVNTTLGADSLGGPQRVNNLLTTLKLPSISHKNLKVMERRAGDMIEDFANMSMEGRGREAFAAEMRYSNLVEDVTLILPSVQNTQLIRDANLVIDSGELLIPNSNTQTNTDGNSVEILNRNPFGLTMCVQIMGGRKEDLLV